MSTALLEREQFAADPVASHSGQFPLGRNSVPAEHSVPSSPTIRPWGLSGMAPARHQGDAVRESFAYDHVQQIAVNATGQPLTEVAATANKVTNNDGDEGPSEDFTYDAVPDFPGSPV
ncbi:putative ATP-grasp-modified RiPP [Amycolatopsis sp. CFH S0078]|uniref:putative ATP-grasp-modified RiPP n=1 Tax=Amycolatopsis sp. CFH S0078 TaxID=1644108 RepID=UPI00106E1883|nr:putative ATP-grasp-modified RiPP [Amycolatopsis sp. CFH S0078]